jgi:hypothetical protein
MLSSYSPQLLKKGIKMVTKLGRKTILVSILINAAIFTPHSFANVFGSVGFERLNDDLSIGTNDISVDVNSIDVSVGYKFSVTNDILFVPEISLGKGFGEDNIDQFRFGGDLLGQEEISLTTLLSVSASIQHQTFSSVYTFGSVVYSNAEYEGEITSGDIKNSGLGIAAGLGYEMVEDLDIMLVASSVDKRKSLKLGLRYHF